MSSSDAQRADELYADFQRMLLILMAVHWYQGEGERAQHYARQLVGLPSRFATARKVFIVLIWPLLLLPGMREGQRRLRTDQQAYQAWEQWARWLVDKYEVRAEGEHDPDT